MKLLSVEMRRIRLSLVASFETSFGVQTERDILLLKAITSDGEGWGECVAGEEPTYSSEYVEGCQHVLIHHLLPRLLSRARAGKLRQVGKRDVKTDTIYIDNCVDAHLLAAQQLRSGAQLGGRTYFISDGAPLGVWTMANRLLAAASAPAVGRPVPSWVAYALGATLEALHFLFRLDREPLMTRFAASELSHAQWFNISAARRDLGYAPRIGIDEGIERVANAFKAAAPAA